MDGHAVGSTPLMSCGLVPSFAVSDCLGHFSSSVCVCPCTHVCVLTWLRQVPPKLQTLLEARTLSPGTHPPRTGGPAQRPALGKYCVPAMLTSAFVYSHPQKSSEPKTAQAVEKSLPIPGTARAHELPAAVFPVDSASGHKQTEDAKSTPDHNH